jgi:predicted oxidoreductase
MTRILALIIIAAVVAGCQPTTPPGSDADVIVVGAGIAGLSAALEAEALGARVLVIDTNSVGGGHAVKAAGFALVDTPLQRALGWRDSPDLAWRDLMTWGEDADPWWTRHYADHARAEVHDWLVGMGVKFTTLRQSAGNSVPRLHLSRHGGADAVVAMLDAALDRPRVTFLWNTEVTGLVRRDGVIAGVRTVRTRTGGKRIYRASAVVIATGGFEGNLERVRKAWGSALPQPARLLNGAGAFARGSALDLTEPLGAAATRLDRQVILVNGLPNPRDASGDRGLLALNPAAIWIDATGRRFTNENASSKVATRAVLDRAGGSCWLVFDSVGARQLTVRGASWLSTQTLSDEILANPALVQRADDIGTLALAAGLPADALTDTVRRYNRFIEQGVDTDFGRLGPGATTPTPPQIREPPFYAMRLFPMTRKSMGGLRIDHEARVLGGAGQVLRGLFAAGEATGVAGINGSHGGSGTFLGPAVLTGRVAGRAAAGFALGPRAGDVPPADAGTDPIDTPATPRGATTHPATPDLDALLGHSRSGYWHFEVSHQLVAERKQRCEDCHQTGWQAQPAQGRAEQRVQLRSCARCH